MRVAWIADDHALLRGRDDSFVLYLHLLPSHTLIMGAWDYATCTHCGLRSVDTVYCPVALEIED